MDKVHNIHSTVHQQEICHCHCSQSYNWNFNIYENLPVSQQVSCLQWNQQKMAEWPRTFGNIFDHSSRSPESIRIQPGLPSASLCMAAVSVSAGVYASSSSSSIICIFSSFPIISLPAPVPYTDDLVHARMHAHTHAHTHNRFTAILNFVRNYPGEPAPER